MLDMEAIKNFSIDKSDWQTVKFGDVVFEPKESVKDPVAEGIQHVVGLEHITSEDIHLRRSAGIEESTTFTKKFSKGDVLFGRRRAYLKKAAKASFEGICSGDITVMRAKAELLLPELLPFVVNNDKFFEYAITHSAGGLSPRVKFKDLANYEFQLPPLEQQGGVFDLLSLANNNLTKLADSLNALIIYRCSREKELFQQDAFKPTLKANEFFSTITDGTHDTPAKQNNGYKLITSKNIVKSKLNLDTDYYLTKSDYDSVNKRSKVNVNDILFGMIGTVGQVCRVIDEPDYAIKNMGLFKTNDKQKSLTAFYYFKSRTFQHKLLQTLSGTTQKYVSLTYLRNLMLPNYSNKEVQAWVESEVYLDLTVETYESQMNAVMKLNKLLLNKVF
jgi:type I restriction enzyme S subunit